MTNHTDNSFQTWAKRAFRNNGIECRNHGNWIIATVNGVDREVMSYSEVTCVCVGFPA